MAQIVETYSIRFQTPQEPLHLRGRKASEVSSRTQVAIQY